jgi:separase
LESAFARVLRLNLKGKPLPPLDDVLLECFAALPAQCRDEELEDLIYFMLDLYQLHSVPVALAEVDMDEVVVEVRSVLEEAAARYSSLPPVEDAHMFLVLDKNVQGIPWDSIPILRGKTISRIPSLSFLIDRLEMDKFYDRSPDARGFRVNPSRAFYVMNPSGDLKSTENTFRDWATEMEPHGWKGLIGRAPMETELINALESRDLFLHVLFLLNCSLTNIFHSYFGHGNGEQFIRSRKIKSLRRCAATMIWGCSSGFMKDMGSFDRTGTPAHYMLAGW